MFVILLNITALGAKPLSTNLDHSDCRHLKMLNNKLISPSGQLEMDLTTLSKTQSYSFIWKQTHLQQNIGHSLRQLIQSTPIDCTDRSSCAHSLQVWMC